MRINDNIKCGHLEIISKKRRKTNNRGFMHVTITEQQIELEELLESQEEIPPEFEQTFLENFWDILA